MKGRSLLVGICMILLAGAGAAWSVGGSPDQWIWSLAPRRSGYVPDPKDTNFYYPLPQVHEFTSPYGWRTHPLYGDQRLHAGVDLGAPEGMPVLSAHSGYVRYADWGDGYGNMVIVEYADGKYQTLYAHLSEILVQDGEAVRPRQVIGKVGSTGGVTGPHLHFELLKKIGDEFAPVNPMEQIQAVEAYVGVRPADDPAAIAQSSPTPPSSPKTGDRPSDLFTAPGLKPRDEVTLNFDPEKFTR
jgi:murein DD-endopeptidase MepM/ murein hydrolase activator NlpD